MAGGQPVNIRTQVAACSQPASIASGWHEEQALTPIRQEVATESARVCRKWTHLIARHDTSEPYPRRTNKIRPGLESSWCVRTEEVADIRCKWIVRELLQRFRPNLNGITESTLIPQHAT